MSFGKAVYLMKSGYKVRVPEWKGYWFVKNGGIWVHTESGEEFVQDNMDWVNVVILRNDWQIAE